MNGQFDGAALGARIKLLRELRDMSLQEVADAAGCTKSHVWELEQGRSTNPTVSMIWSLAKALTVTPSQLLGLDHSKPQSSSFALRIAGMIDREMTKLAKPNQHTGGII